ncbi:MAG: carbohydrate binding domain-containing protein [Allomuricauda sp.]
MKNSLKYILSTIALVALLFVAGCEEDDNFTIVPVSVEQISVDSAFPGDPVSLTGSNFNTVQFIFVGDQQAQFQLTDNTITFNVPQGADIGSNTITLAMANNYRVNLPFEVLLRPIPVIETFDAFVPVGGDLVINGLSLNAEYSPVVTIDGVQATITSNTATQLVVTVPDVADDEFLDLAISSIHGETTATTKFLARESVLANGQLEEGSGDDFTAWEKLNGGDRMTAVTGEEAYGGGRSMMVMPASGNPWDNQFASDGVQLNFGEEYTMIIWAKAINEGAFLRFSISQFDGNGADYFYGEDKVLETFWAPYSWTFTVTNDLASHRAVLDMGASSGAFIIDHIALVPGALSAGGEQPELLANGSFEDGLTGWTTLNGSHDVSTTEFYCGTTSMTATGAGNNPWDTQLASDPMVLEVGTDYEISFWAKAAGPDGVFRISMSQFASGQSDDFFYSPDLEIPEDWTYFSFITTAQATSTGDQRLLFDMGVTTQTFFVDGVSVKEYVPPVSLYANGDFEDGLTGWTTLNGAHSTSTDAHTGSGSLTATGAGGNPWDTQLASDPVALTPGQDYKISFWAKAAGPDGVFRISMSQFASGQSDDFFYSPDLAIPEDWTYFSFITTAQATSTGDHRLLFDMGVTTQTFFVDDVIVAEYDGCE